MPTNLRQILGECKNTCESIPYAELEKKYRCTGSYCDPRYRCIWECVDEKIKQADPCLADCIYLCQALTEIIEGNMTAEKWDCLLKCREALSCAQ